MNHLEVVLKQSIIFSELSADDLDRLIPLFQKRPLHTGDVLCTSGHRAQFFFLLEKGCLLLAMEGGKACVLDAPGDLAALELLSRKGVCVSTITALDNGCAWAILREDFLGFIQEDTPAAASVMAGWQESLDQKAPFAKTIMDIDIPVMF